MVFFLRHKEYMRISIWSIYGIVHMRARETNLVNLKIIFLFDSSRVFA